MRARAHVAAESSRDGGTRLTSLRSQAPLVLQRTAAGVTMVAGAGGPLGGDEIDLDIDVSAGAALRLGSVAAMVVQPGQPGQPAEGGGNVARLTVRADVGSGAVLHWEPEPTVVTADAALESQASVRCGRGVSLVWREILVLGRLDQPGGTVSSTLVVDADDRPLLRQTVRAGPDAPAGWDGPAGVAGHRVLGTLLLLGDVADGLAPGSQDGEVPYAVMPLEAGGLLVTVLGATTLEVRRTLDALRSPSPTGPAPTKIIRDVSR